MYHLRNNRMEMKNHETEPLRTEKPEKRKKCRLLSEVFKDYSSSTSIHGIGYLGAENKTLAEKIWWLLVFSLSVVACSHLIYKTWRKWNDNPVVVAFAQEQTPIWEIPFPAVTICPICKTSLFKYNFGDKLQHIGNLTGDDHKMFWDISLVCNLREYGVEPDNNTMMTTDEEFLTSIKSVQSTIIVSYIKWQNKMYDLEDLLVERLTDEGLCYTFNSFNQDDIFTDAVNKNVSFIQHDLRNEGWEVDSGYDSHLNLNSYPYRTTEDGLHAGLSVVLGTTVKERDFACGIPVTGYKVALHNPVEVPTVSQQFFLVPESRQLVATVKPELIKTTPGLRNIAAHTRKCYLEKEKHLKFFKVYTQNNCKMECVANMTKEYCGCVPFYMPRDNQTLICSFGKVLCMEEVRDTILKYEMMQKADKVSPEEKEKITYKIYDNCDCLPSCASLQFTAETSQAKTYFLKTLEATGQEHLIRDENSTETIEQMSKLFKITKIDIFFKETQFIALYRNELYGQTDFLANCGGLLGLFMGFSILSLVEIFYFLTIRICCELRNRGGRNDVQT